MFLGGAVGVVIDVLFPGLWAFLYQAPIGFGVAYVVAQQQARDPLDSKTAAAFAAICGGGGAFWFLLMGVVPSLLTLLLALAGLWIGKQPTCYEPNLRPCMVVLGYNRRGDIPVPSSSIVLDVSATRGEGAEGEA